MMNFSQPLLRVCPPEEEGAGAARAVVGSEAAREEAEAGGEDGARGEEESEGAATREASPFASSLRTGLSLLALRCGSSLLSLLALRCGGSSTSEDSSARDLPRLLNPPPPATSSFRDFSRTMPPSLSTE